jgi:amidase
VADFMVPIALGTQTGGSVLRPAAYCGVFGYKPTFGAFNRAGIKFAAESLDTIGLIARSIEDIELLTAILLGKQSSASQARGAAPKIGLCRTPLWDTAQPETVHAIEDSAKRLSAAGAQIHEITLPNDFAGLKTAARETINNYERSKGMAFEWNSHRDLISEKLRRSIQQGLETPHEDYVGALRLGEHCRRQMDKVFDGVDVLLAPCVNGEAPIGLAYTGDPGFQAIWTILHAPTMTLPTHHGPNGLPVGIQLVAPAYQDDRLFACARWIWQRLGPVSVAE